MAEPLSLPELLDPQRAALIVIDMQNDFCHPEGSLPKHHGLAVAASHAILPKLHELATAARSAGVPVIYTQMMNDPRTQSPAFLGRKAVFGRPPICRTGSWGAELWGVEPEPDDIRVVKHRHSAFHGTDLDLRLRSLRRDAVVLTGVNTNVCVESTARDACALDYWTLVVADATAAYTLEEHLAALRNIDRYFGLVVSCEDVLRIWNASSSAR